jgi:hypothetical protein
VGGAEPNQPPTGANKASAVVLRTSTSGGLWVGGLGSAPPTHQPPTGANKVNEVNEASVKKQATLNLSGIYLILNKITLDYYIGTLT